MNRVHEQAIDGGRSYCVDDDTGRRMIAHLYDDGRRELRFHEPRATHPTATVRLDDDDARRLGAVLSGVRFRPVVPSNMIRHVRDLAVDWVRIETGSSAVGRSVTQLDLHRRTGMTAIAVVRGDATFASHLADLPLAADDRVVVVGQLRQMPVLQDLLTS